jgi:nucleoside-diphosphate-sugar epimerase
MGGAGYIFTGEHNAKVMANNVLINTNVARVFSHSGCGRLLYTSSSCVMTIAWVPASFVWRTLARRG